MLREPVEGVLGCWQYSMTYSQKSSAWTRHCRSRGCGWWLGSFWYYYWQRHQVMGYPPMSFSRAWRYATASNSAHEVVPVLAWGDVDDVW